MKLSQRIGFSFVGFIVAGGAVSTIATSVILDYQMRHEIETTEVVFARSLSTRLFKNIKDRNSIAITDTLFDELGLRPEKLAYLMVFDGGGGRLAHTFLSQVPPRLAQGFGASTSAPGDHRVERITDSHVDAYDVSVPVLEGIAQVGSIHIGLQRQYLEGVKRQLVRMTLISTTAMGILALLVALFLTRHIVLPVRKLTNVASELSKGNLNVSLPGLKTKDEIQDLEASLESVLAAVATLMADVDPPREPVVLGEAASSSGGVA